jgi:two-component system osmolarity sensor histidine kinase EnvZ
MARPLSLFARTGITLSVALGAFLMFTVAAMVNFILIPLARQGADDLAALMVLAAQTWVEVPPATRPFLEEELMQEYQLALDIADESTEGSSSLLPFLMFLEQALAERTGQPTPIHKRAGNEVWYCADIPMGGRIIRVSFPSQRIGARPPTAALLVLAAGSVVILLTSLLLVRRLTRPIDLLTEATSRLGRGETLPPLPEAGPREFVTLTQNFNRMATEIARLLANRTTLFAGISHDLRTPITRMQLALEMLPDSADPELVRRLRNDLEQMDRLITDTLDLARGLGQEEKEEIDLRELCDALVSDYRSSGNAIDWQPGDCCVCPVDTLALRRIMTNLIDNALRYGGGKPVGMECRCRPDAAIIDILDRGPGVPESEREAVFLPFRRLEASRSRRTGGSGLGLAIAGQLGAVHGWGVELLSRDGGGTIARIRIPRSSI